MPIVDSFVRHPFLLHETGLSADLGSDFVVWQTSCRKDWDLLPAGD